MMSNRKNWAGEDLRMTLATLDFYSVPAIGLDLHVQ